MKTLRFRFTLVEVLAVVALVSLLAAIGFGAYSYAMNASRESNSKALFKRIEAGLESCRTKYGYYPASQNFRRILIQLDTQLDTSTKLVSDIQFDVSSSETGMSGTSLSDEMRKEFLRVIEEESLKKGKTGDFVLEDSWGGAISYRYPGQINKGGFDLIAPGADGGFGSGKAENPPEPTEGSLTQERDYYYSSDNEKICDDITNF